jgi:transcriptional regulator with XRE-family HTH domain
MSDFGERLRTTREMLGLGQAGLAAKAGIAATSISHFEGGSREPNLANLRKLKKALGVPYEMLLGEDGGKNKTATVDG